MESYTYLAVSTHLYKRSRSPALECLPPSLLVRHTSEIVQQKAACIEILRQYAQSA